MLQNIAPVKVADLEIGDGVPARIIAETASSHEGDPALALRLLRAAQEAGADFIKFQLLRADELLTPDHPKYDSFRIIEMPAASWQEIAVEGHRLGARLIAEVFDEGSVALAQSLPFSALKIHSTDVSNPRMLDSSAETGLPLFLSSGGTTFVELDQAVRRLRQRGVQSIVLLHGFQSFPTRIEDSNLLQIRKLRDCFGLHVGYADHVDAESEMAMFLPMMAIGAGARIVEKHITPDRSKKGRDYYSALNPDEFGRLVRLVRDADPAMYQRDDSLSRPELEYRARMKKTIVAGRELASGAVLEDSDLAFKRASTIGSLPSEASTWIGRRLRRSVARNRVLTDEDFSS